MSFVSTFLLALVMVTLAFGTSFAKEKEKVVVIKTEKGDIVIKLMADVAPKHVENFLKLTKEGFYNGLTFHRVEPNFVIQGGDPKGDGTGGPGYKVKAEFNKQQHVRGAVA